MVLCIDKLWPVLKGKDLSLKVHSFCGFWLRKFYFPALILGLASVLVCGCGSGSSSGGSGGGGTTPTPTISSISPTTTPAGSSALTLTVSGSGFLSTSVVQVDSKNETTTYVSGSQLTATVPATQLASGAELAVVVSNGSASSGSGTPVNLEVQNPVPVIASISPTSESTGATAAIITVTGTGFVPTTVINVNGVARATTFTNSTQVSVTLTAADVAAAGTLALTAVNTSPGGGTSTATNLNIVAPPVTPVISSISPAAVVAGSSALTLKITGSGFQSTSVVQVASANEATTYVSATQLTAIVPASQLAAGGELPVVVLNGSLSSGSSTPINLEVDNPAPTITLISPTSIATGATSPVITVTGTGFVPATVINVNGAARATTVTSSTQISVSLTAADVSTATNLLLTAVNPAPGGGTSTAVTLNVFAPTATPVISSLSPTSIVAGSGDTALTVTGTGFTQDSLVQWNGASLVTTVENYYGGTQLLATVPATDLTSTGTASVTVNTPTATPPLSNVVTVSITNPPMPTLTSMYPNSGPLSTSASITLTGTGFTASSTVALNGVEIASTFVDSTQIAATIPASSAAFPGNIDVTVTTPAPGGGTTPPIEFTTYIAIPNNDIAYNAADGLLYASVPSSSPGVAGNSVVGIDPSTGNVMRQIQVGSNPNKLAISTDGTQLFVGLDGAGAVAQVDLTNGAVVNQFSLSNANNPVLTAAYLAAVPGSPNSVAVSMNANVFDGIGSDVMIYDSGVARSIYPNNPGLVFGPLSFGSSASTLYLANYGSTIEKLTVDSTGITGATSLFTSQNNVTSLQYDNGRLYMSTGAVIDATSGALSGTFYSTSNTPATGPVVSDSSLGKAFIAESNYLQSTALLGFDENSFNLNGTIPVNGATNSSGFIKIVRWGQNGLAANDYPGYFNNSNQIFVFQSPLVKDLSSSPADIAVSLAAPATASTGTAVSWTATVSNMGPNPAQSASLSISLDPSLIINSVTASQGSCGTGVAFNCNLGNLTSGASVTVTVSATPTSAGTLVGTSSISSTSYDPNAANNTSTTSTTVTGSLYGGVPSISAISPNLVQAGSADFTLTVTGTGFSAGSIVNLGATPLSTTYTSAIQLTATVTAAEIANYGWAAITVTNPSPGGGISQVAPLTIYDLVNVPANGLLFDPYSQFLYATLPGTATTLTGNSILTINPVSGVVGTPIAVGSQPTVLAETGDGNYLYIGLSGANSLAKFDLSSQKVVATIPLISDQLGTTGSVAATSLSVMPGSDSTLVMTMTGTWGLFGVFDVNGNTGSFRPNLSGIYQGTNPVFADPTHVYAAGLYRYGVDANGLNLIDATNLNGMGQGFQLIDNLIYGQTGGIANPQTTPPSQIATLNLFDFYDSGISGYGVGVAADPSLGKEFLMMENTAGTWAYGLARYDLTTYLPEALLDMPSSLSAVETSWTMMRWGQDGLALLASEPSFGSGSNQPTVVIMLMRGPFVAPQELETNSVASLAASSVTSIAHGSGNATLTLSGSNFLPGIAVTWNGNYRTTTIVDATHISVAIPASDLTTAGTASLVASNPGAVGSNALQIVIN